jgi:hypothetical protein
VQHDCYRFLAVGRVDRLKVRGEIVGVYGLFARVPAVRASPTVCPVCAGSFGAGSSEAARSGANR